MGRAQVSNEFVILMGVAVLMTMVFLFLVGESMQERTIEKERLALRDMGLALQQELFTAVKLKDGYHREIELPEKYKNTAYTVVIFRGYLLLDAPDTGNHQEFAVPDVQGNFSKGKNTITKTGGVVYIS